MFGDCEKCLIVAEAGTSHGGRMGDARKLIDAAKEAGADCVKFQMVFADEIVHPLVGEIELPSGRERVYERFRAVEREIGFYEELKRYTESRELLFLCTPFGTRSARMLREMGVRAIKIASPELNHYPLLEEVATYGLPLVLSSGVSTLGDIERALRVTGRDVVLLHCVTSYPAPERQYNLRLLQTLSAVFGVRTGISDHSLDATLVPVLSVALGAVMVEKHFTLSRHGAGLDDPIALNPRDFAHMVREMRRGESLGSEGAIAVMKERHGDRLVEEVLGDGIKYLAPCEEDNYQTTNRSVISRHRIRQGQRITAALVSLLRSEKNCRPGLSGEFLSLVVGRTAKKGIPAGVGVTWDDLM